VEPRTFAPIALTSPPSTRGESCTRHREVGIEIDRPKCRLAAGNLDSSAERQVNLIDGRKRGNAAKSTM
jgi:hypothetical protein